MEMSKANGGKMENSNRVKDGNRKLALEEAEVHKILKDYYEDLYDIDTQEQAAVNLYGTGGTRRDYFRQVNYKNRD